MNAGLKCCVPQPSRSQLPGSTFSGTVCSGYFLGGNFGFTMIDFRSPYEYPARSNPGKDKTRRVWVLVRRLEQGSERRDGAKE